MSMLLYSCLLTVVLGLAPVVALGDDHSHRKAAENLLIVMEVDKSLPKIADQVVDTQVQLNPQLAAQREVLPRFFTKYLNWASVREDTITAFTHEFTEPELKKLTEFLIPSDFVVHSFRPPMEEAMSRLWSQLG